MSDINDIINELIGISYRISTGEIPQSTSLTTGASKEIMECVEKLKTVTNKQSDTPIECKIIDKKTWRDGLVNIGDNMFRVTIDISKKNWCKLLDKLQEKL